MQKAHPFGFFIKWCFDRIGACCGLVVLSPLLLAVALLHKMLMPKGPVLFRQERVGQHGKTFMILKIRTMKETGPEDTVPTNHITVANDPRIPKFGAWLRRTKMDTLFELVNILKGDMSFVGPRPDVPGYADRLEGTDRELLLLKPGLTGPASLKYRHEETLLAMQPDPVAYNDQVIWPDKVSINLEYLHNWSLWLDIKLIFNTIF